MEGKKSKFIFLDVTFLRFGGDQRGIPQVLFVVMDILCEASFRGLVRFLAYPDVAQAYLYPRGIPAHDIVFVPEIFWFSRIERFHGLFSTWRYRQIISQAALLIHPEARTITRHSVPQIVFWYDFLQMDRKILLLKKPSRYLFVRYKYWQASRKSRAITISEYTRREALRLFPKMDKEKITTLWLGVRKNLDPGLLELKPLKSPLRCIYVGSLEPRKNVFSLLSHLDILFGGLPFSLELVGKTSDSDRAQLTVVLQKIRSKNSVILRGLVSDLKLRELMQTCDITFYPSLREGFGLPIAEAMAYGHLVFAFRNTSIPEIGGNAVVLAENNDFGAWAQALKRLWENPSESVALRQQALNRSLLFSEEKMKERFRKYFQNLLPSNPNSER